MSFIENFKILSSGYEVSNESDIPIHIDLGLFLEWLIDRRIVPSDWKTPYDPLKQNVSSLREQIESEYATNEVVREFLKDKEQFTLTYFDLLDLKNLLISSNIENDSKNLFGTYQSQILNVIHGILNQYTKQNLHLCESASLLKRLQKSDIPATEKLIQKHEKNIIDYEKKKINFERQITNTQKQFDQECLDLGIEGKHFESEIWNLTEQIPSILNQALELCHDPIVVDALEYFYKFQSLVTVKSLDEASHLKVLEQIISQKSSLQSDKERIPIEIVEALSNDFNIESSPHPDTQTNENTNAHILDSVSLRSSLLDDLYLLSSFFKQRYLESMESATSNSISIVYANDIEEMDKNENLARFKDHIMKIIDTLTSSHIQMLWDIQHSKQYLKRLCQTFDQKLNHIQNIQNIIQDVNIKRHETEHKLAKSKIFLESINQRLHYIKTNTELALSNKYNNRKVFIK